ncbi:hypothetical protein VU11_05215, partial [Desulfobulbus sp. US2]|nr:hypothetical protein [Desulfobulbus sp. US2]
IPETPAKPVPQAGQQGDKKDASRKSPDSHPALHLAPLKSELGQLAPALRPLYQKLWFQFLMAAALFCLLAAWCATLGREDWQGIRASCGAKR